MSAETYYYQWIMISAVMYLVPLVGVIITIVWKLSSVAHRVTENKTDLEELANRLRAFEEEVDRKNTNLSQQVQAANKNATEISVSIKYIKETIEQIRKSQEEMQGNIKKIWEEIWKSKSK